MADVSSVASSSQKTIEQIIEEQAKKTENTRNTGELGKDDFLKLLITQVQHQDPMNPASDTDFIAQMAQFSALEQMQNLNTSFSFSKGFSLIGKYVSAQNTNADTGETSYISGRVESARMNSGKVYVIVNGQEVNVDQITDVADTALDSANGSISDYSGLIGMLGSAWITNDDNKKGTIEGIISSVEKETDGIYAHLDEVDLKPEDLDMTGYDSPEAYVTANAGKEITVKVKDPETGAEIRVTGTLRDGYVDDSDSLRLILDDVKAPVDSIYSTKRVDLLSTEQMLLTQILQTLKDGQGTGSGSGTDGGNTDGTDPGTGTTDPGT